MWVVFSRAQENGTQDKRENILVLKISLRLLFFWMTEFGLSLNLLVSIGKARFARTKLSETDG